MGRQIFRDFLRNESGATAMEYALLASLIAITIVGSFVVFGDAVANMFGSGGTTDVLREQTERIP